MIIKSRKNNKSNIILVFPCCASNLFKLYEGMATTFNKYYIHDSFTNFLIIKIFAKYFLAVYKNEYQNCFKLKNKQVP